MLRLHFPQKEFHRHMSHNCWINYQKLTLSDIFVHWVESDAETLGIEWSQGVLMRDLNIWVLDAFKAEKDKIHILIREGLWNIVEIIMVITGRGS